MARKFRVSQKDHPLVRLIYDKGYTICGFSRKIHYDESFIHQILNHKSRKCRPNTIQIIADGLGVDYYDIEVMVNET